MPRFAGTLALALVIGLLSYRAALATMPERIGGDPLPDCPGIVTPAHFDLMTGFPVPAGCTYAEGPGVLLLYASADMYDHFNRSLRFGLAVLLFAFVALWWLARRQPTGARRPSEVASSV